MRVVAGRFRGRALTAPEGDETRPTTDRLREAVFNILASRLSPDLGGMKVLDLFAGSGALGIEALSRGADYGVFVETGAAARGAIRTNLESLGLFGTARILRRDATDLGPAGGLGPFRLIFCDPPYGKGLGERALASALSGGWIAGDGLVVLEEARKSTIALPDGLFLIDERSYGETKVLFLTPDATLAA